MSDVYSDYGLLLGQFLGGAISVEEFQMTYLQRFKNEKRRLGGELYELLEGLFGDVDAFSTDPQLLKENPSFYLDEEGLREKVRRVANELSGLDQ